MKRRVFEHRQRRIPGFTQKYNVVELMYFEAFRDVWDAIAREKQVKAWSRAKRIALIETMNPHWKDLGSDWYPSAPEEKPAERFLGQEAPSE